MTILCDFFLFSNIICHLNQEKCLIYILRQKEKYLEIADSTSSAILFFLFSANIDLIYF